MVINEPSAYFRQERLFCLFARERDLIIDDFAFQRRRPMLCAKIQDKKTGVNPIKLKILIT